jgi:mannosyl-oligosaccharide alpha-1,2-mannosidase
MADDVLLQSAPNNLTFVAERQRGAAVGKMDHLVCFLPALLALGAREGAVEGEEAALHLQWAKELANTCYMMYNRTRTGMAPEIVRFGVRMGPGGMSNRNGLQNQGEESIEDFIIDPGARHALLRPEALEALYGVWKSTGDQVYRDQAWAIFMAMVKYCRVATGGYTGLRDVDDDSMDERYLDADQSGVLPGETKPYVWKNWNDKQESFFLAESMKYLYMIFSDDDPIKGFVLNTEAHPLPIDTTWQKNDKIGL